MEHIVDLHIHSHYSRATSPAMNIASLYRWGKIKGITVIGTGDFTHPAWIKELQEKLVPAEEGLFTLKPEFAKIEDATLPAIVKKRPIRFVLTAEISTIYSKNSRVRKLHSIIVVSSFSAALKLNEQLNKIGNLKADGRPILGLDSKELLRITLDTDTNALFIPAHAWTPWFAIFGSKSGFDSLEEAFEELAPHVHAIETGLSSDPFMNWRLSKLDSITLISNSDAHSPAKLGREANVIACDLAYKEIAAAIQTGDKRFVGTIEFFPEEGKYHYDGHRDCGVVLPPEETKKIGGICPKCKKPLTLGVDYRIQQLADRPESFRPVNHKSVEYIVPLQEIIAQSLSTSSVQSKKVQLIYEAIYSQLGDEFSILRSVSIPKIAEAGFERIAYGIERMRQGRITRIPGYDGVFGTISVFADEYDQSLQLGLSFG